MVDEFKSSLGSLFVWALMKQHDFQVVRFSSWMNKKI
jgi:hypothetical protein